LADDRPCAHKKRKKEQNVMVAISTTTKEITKPLCSFVTNTVGNTKEQQRRQEELFCKRSSTPHGDGAIGGHFPANSKNPI
jgi:hypothetical protein